MMVDQMCDTSKAAAKGEQRESFARNYRNFMYRAPKDDQPERYETLRRCALHFADLIVEVAPASREQSLALTKLEEAIMWANAAIARNE
jgi:hypothetical protein